MYAKSAIHTNEPVEESPSLLVFDRKRAKSYPSERPSEPIALLELPKQPQPIEEEEEEEEEEENGVSSFTHSVSCRMATVLSVATVDLENFVMKLSYDKFSCLKCS